MNDLNLRARNVLYALSMNEDIQTMCTPGMLLEWDSQLKPSWLRLMDGVTAGPGCRPRLQDDLTVLALLLKFREATGDREAYTRTRQGPPSLPLWAVYATKTNDNLTSSQVVGTGHTEAGALVNALESLLN